MKRLAIVMAVVGIVLGFAGNASAAKPTVERIEIDDSFVDEFFSEECGFPVTGVAKGHIIVRIFDRDQGLVELRTLNIGITLSADGNDYSFRDVGADQIRVTPDGVVILSIIGQVPFEFTGVLKINLDTEEVILEPQHTTQGEIEEACQVLGG